MNLDLGLDLDLVWCCLGSVDCSVKPGLLALVSCILDLDSYSEKSIACDVFT